MKDYKENDICPICEHGILICKNKDLKFTYKNNITLLNRDVLHCEFCNEAILKQKDADELDEILTNIRNNVDKSSK